MDRATFEDFLIHEAGLLDSRRFRDWMGLFADDGTYWVPAVPYQQSPFDQASLFYDDRDLMRTRVLPSVKIGRARRVPVIAVRAYVD